MSDIVARLEVVARESGCHIDLATILDKAVCSKVTIQPGRPYETENKEEYIYVTPSKNHDSEYKPVKDEDKYQDYPKPRGSGNGNPEPYVPPSHNEYEDHKEPSYDGPKETSYMVEDKGPQYEDDNDYTPRGDDNTPSYEKPGSSPKPDYFEVGEEVCQKSTVSIDLDLLVVSGLLSKDELKDYLKALGALGNEEHYDVNDDVKVDPLLGYRPTSGGKDDDGYDAHEEEEKYPVAGGDHDEEDKYPVAGGDHYGDDEGNNDDEGDYDDEGNGNGNGDDNEDEGGDNEDDWEEDNEEDENNGGNEDDDENDGGEDEEENNGGQDEDEDDEDNNGGDDEDDEGEDDDENDGGEDEDEDDEDNNGGEDENEDQNDEDDEENNGGDNEENSGDDEDEENKDDEEDKPLIDLDVLKGDKVVDLSVGNKVLDAEVLNGDSLADVKLGGDDGLHLSMLKDGKLLSLTNGGKSVLGLRRRGGATKNRKSKKTNKKNSTEGPLMNVKVGGKELKPEDKGTLVNVEVATESKGRRSTTVRRGKAEKKGKGPVVNAKVGGKESKVKGTLVNAEVATEPRAKRSIANLARRDHVLSHYQPLCKKGFKKDRHDEAHHGHADDVSHCLSLCHAEAARETKKDTEALVCAAVEFTKSHDGDNCFYFVAPESKPCHDDELEDNEDSTCFYRN